MKQKNSVYNSTKDLKITYFLGAGASYNSIPIWKSQGESMIKVSTMLKGVLTSNNTLNDNKGSIIYKNKTLIHLANRIKFFGLKAVEYGSIDIYARKLYLTNDKSLNELKYILSIYFELWENFLHSGQYLSNTKTTYDKIDKRYMSLLSVILEKNQPKPKLNSNISFITWNYDLQLEMAYNLFLSDSSNYSLKK